MLPRIPRRIALSVAAACAATACGPAVDITQSINAEIAPPPGLANPGHLTVAVPADLPPYAYPGKRGSEGFNVDLAAALARRMGLRLSLVALDPQDLPAAARGNGVDVVLGGLEVSALVTPPPDLTLVAYVKAQSEFLIREDSPYQPRQLDEICGHNVAVVAGTPQQRLIAEAVQICGQGPPNPRVARSDGEALRMLDSQAVDVYLADSATAAFAKARHGGVMTTVAPFAETELGMGMRNAGTPLVDAITRSFYLTHSDGTYEVLLQKWGMSALTL